MSFADDFVLTREDGVPIVPHRSQNSADHRSIVDVAYFENLLFELNNGVDFGPFVGTSETPETHLANRRWLRVIALVSAAGQPLIEGWGWLDRPNESLGWISPFEATADDEAFGRACALAFLTGGNQAEPETTEAQLLAEFSSSHAVLLASTNRHDSFLSGIFWALHECTGSLILARLMLTCAPVSGENSATLFRLARECDAETINEILRTQFGYTGEGLDH
jgi:hypothetical protein